jgi:hypothetical protein
MGSAGTVGGEDTVQAVDEVEREKPVELAGAKASPKPATDVGIDAFVLGGSQPSLDGAMPVLVRRAAPSPGLPLRIGAMAGPVGSGEGAGEGEPEVWTTDASASRAG